MLNEWPDAVLLYIATLDEFAKVAAGGELIGASAFEMLDACVQCSAHCAACTPRHQFLLFSADAVLSLLLLLLLLWK